MALIFSSALVDVVVALTTCLVLMYLYLGHVYKYWEKRGVHYLIPNVIFGNMGSVLLRQVHMGEFFAKVYKENSGHPVVGIFVGKKPALVVRDLDVVRSIMVKDAHTFLDRSIEVSDGNSLGSRNLFALKGKRWRHMRVKLTPTFTSGKIKNMFYLINECGKELLHCIDKETSTGKSVEVKEILARYSTDVIASCAFGVDAKALSDADSEFRATMSKVFKPSTLRYIMQTLSVIAPWLLKRIALRRSDNEIYRFVRKTFWDVANYRKENGVVRKDFVDILLQMRSEGEVRIDDAKESEEIRQDTKYVNTPGTKTDTLDIKLEDDDFVAQAYVFILAGFETSSSVITFTLFELALHPDIQDRLRREIQAVLDKHNSEVTYDTIAEMNYLEMVVSETLRIHPTLPNLERKCLQDYKIPGTNITIEKGTSVNIPILGIHMDPAIYSEPDRFDPERFSTENKSKRSNFAHMPFGEGPRICIGMRFGQMQVKTALVHILTSYKIKPCAETPSAPLGLLPSGIVNVPRKNIILEFHKIM